MKLHDAAMQLSKRARPLSQREQMQISVATRLAYHRFRCESSTYHHSIGNYLMLMDWIDERRIEMEAEGRRYWVPTNWDLWKAERDCWNDLVREPSHACTLAGESV